MIFRGDGTGRRPPAHSGRYPGGRTQRCGTLRIRVSVRSGVSYAHRRMADAGLTVAPRANRASRRPRGAVAEFGVGPARHTAHARVVCERTAKRKPSVPGSVGCLLVLSLVGCTTPAGPRSGTTQVPQYRGVGLEPCAALRVTGLIQRRGASTWVFVSAEVSPSPRLRDRCGPRLHAELGEEAGEVGLHGGLTDEEVAGDGRVVVPFCRCGEDLQFAW